MAQVIMFKNNDGGVSVIHPSPEALAKYGIDAIAVKDVPSGKPYKIIDAVDLPDRDNRNQWTVDDADLTDGIGGELNEFN